MKNKILAITRDSIPYVKSIRPIAGSVTATILMQQLDYWFARHPDGFYKFLEPCNHPLYKTGDSWIEELGFSKDEFRTAFARLGIQYKSKSQYNEAKKEGDPFAGKFYCSYFDRVKGQVFYHRNHETTDQALDTVLVGSNPATPCKSATPISRSRESQFLDVGNPDLDITKTTSETTSQNPKDSVKCSLARSEVEKSENFEFEIAAARAADAVAPSALLNATQGQPALAEGGVEGEEVLVKLQRLCKVGKHLEQKLMDNPAAARFALGQLEYALANGAPIDNPAGFFHNELKASIKRRNPEYNPQSKNTTKGKKNGQQAASTPPHAEIPYPITIGGSEEAKPLEKVRRLSREEFNALPVGEYFYMSNGNLPKDLHGCGYGSRSPILWLYQIVTSAGGYSSVIDVATGKKINLGPIVMAHGSGKDRLGYTEEVHCYKPKSTFCA